ncbi:MAG TPA: GNAT family N-acetyltransferase [Candidatus Bipolaricaulota bacterium]
MPPSATFNEGMSTQEAQDATRIKLLTAASPGELDQAHALFRQYAQWLDDNDPDGVDLCFQGFEQELAELPGKYAPPQGRLLLARCGEEEAGCVAVRPFEFDPSICEMKRLYVRPEFMGRGIGKCLVEAIIQAGKELKYRAMRLDTLPYMKAAIALYQAHGFKPIPRYYDTPLKDTIFMELEL